MSSIRDIRDQARRQLHEALHLAAVYVAFAGTQPIATKVRHFPKHDVTSSVGGAPQGLAQFTEADPKMRLLVEDVPTPLRRALIFISETEAYRVQLVHPPHGITVDVDVAQLDAEDVAANWQASYAELLG